MLTQGDFRRIETWEATHELNLAGGSDVWERMAEDHTLFKLIQRRCTVADLRSRVRYLFDHGIDHENSHALVLYIKALEALAPVAAKSLAETALEVGGMGVCERWVLEGMVERISDLIFADVRANRELGMAVAV